ncbi:MAG: metal ABC transporter permease [Acidobacteriota bacterium]
MSFLTLIDPFIRYGFLQRALLAGLFIAVACAVLGVFLVLRGESMIGHGLAHTAFAGVALGLLLDMFPLGIAMAVAIMAALLISRIKEGSGLSGDTGIAIFSSVGFALGIVIASLARGFNVDLFAYLFGEILAISPLEVWLSVSLALVVLMTIFLFYSRLVYMTFDRESARASGIRVDRLDALLTVLTAVTVVLGMKVVGIILVSALVVLPAAAGLQVASNFKKALVFAVLNATMSVGLGLLLSYHLDIPASGAVVLLSFLFFGILFVLRKARIFRSF